MKRVRDRQKVSMTVKECGRKREWQAILATGQGKGENGRQGERETSTLAKGADDRQGELETRSVAGKVSGKQFKRQAKGEDD